MVRPQEMSLRSPEPSRTPSKRRNGYLQALNYASFFNARRTGLVSPSDITPTPKGSKKSRRRFNCFNERPTDTTISENDSKSQGEASVGTKIACQGSDAQMADLVAALDIESKPAKRAKSSTGDKGNGNGSTMSNGRDVEDYAGENVVEEGEVIMKDGVVFCPSVGCMPAVRVAPRMFGRVISNQKGNERFDASPLASSANKVLHHSADEESVHKASRKITPEPEIADIDDDDDSVDSDPSPAALETRFADGTKEQENAVDVCAGSDNEQVQIALAVLESAQEKVVQQLQREVRRLEEACIVSEGRAAAANGRKAQAEDAVSRAMAALQSARVSLRSLENASNNCAARARDSRVAADEAKEQLKQLQAQHHAERVNLLKMVRDQTGSRTRSADILKEVATTVSNLNFAAGSDASAISKMDAVLARLQLHWVQYCVEQKRLDSLFANTVCAGQS